MLLRSGVPVGWPVSPVATCPSLKSVANPRSDASDRRLQARSETFPTKRKHGSNLAFFDSFSKQKSFPKQNRRRKIQCYSEDRRESRNCFFFFLRRKVAWRKEWSRFYSSSYVSRCLNKPKLIIYTRKGDIQKPTSNKRKPILPKHTS